MKIKLFGMIFTLNRKKPIEVMYAKEQYYFKQNFFRYIVVYKMRWEFWARSTKRLGENYLLGTYDPISKELQKDNGLYVTGQFPWTIAKGAERLFEEVFEGIKRG